MGFDEHLPVVFHRDSLDALEPKAMVVLIAFRGLGQTVFEGGDGPFVIVLDMDDEAAVYLLDAQTDESLAWVLHLHEVFDRVVQGVPKERVDVVLADERKRLPIDDIGQGDPVFLAEEELLRKHDVQRVVPRLRHRVVDHDRMLDLLDRFLVEAPVEVMDLMLEVVAFDVDEADVLLRELIMLFVLFP